MPGKQLHSAALLCMKAAECAGVCSLRLAVSCPPRKHHREPVIHGSAFPYSSVRHISAPGSFHTLRIFFLISVQFTTEACSHTQSSVMSSTFGPRSRMCSTNSSMSSGHADVVPSKLDRSGFTACRHLSDSVAILCFSSSARLQVAAGSSCATGALYAPNCVKLRLLAAAQCM